MADSGGGVRCAAAQRRSGAVAEQCALIRRTASAPRFAHPTHSSAVVIIAVCVCVQLRSPLVMRPREPRYDEMETEREAEAAQANGGALRSGGSGQRCCHWRHLHAVTSTIRCDVSTKHGSGRARRCRAGAYDDAVLTVRAIPADRSSPPCPCASCIRCASCLLSPISLSQIFKTKCAQVHRQSFKRAFADPLRRRLCHSSPVAPPVRVLNYFLVLSVCLFVRVFSATPSRLALATSRVPPCSA